MAEFYILEAKEPKWVPMNEWVRLFDNESKVVQQTDIGAVHVSTVFLGIDHSHGDGEPILFETMVFGGEHDQFQERYSTWDEAVKGHEQACEKVKTA